MNHRDLAHSHIDLFSGIAKRWRISRRPPHCTYLYSVQPRSAWEFLLLSLVKSDASIINCKSEWTNGISRLIVWMSQLCSTYQELVKLESAVQMYSCLNVQCTVYVVHTLYTVHTMYSADVQSLYICLRWLTMLDYLRVFSRDNHLSMKAVFT